MTIKKTFPGKITLINTRMRFIMTWLISLGLLCQYTLTAQPYPVSISIAVTPPYTTRIDDYISQPNKIIATFVNTSFETIEVYVLGSITGQGGIVVQTDPDHKMYPPLILYPGAPYQLTRSNLEQVFDADNLQVQGISKKEVLYGNGLPEDDYTICLQAFDYSTGTPASAESPLGCSNEFNVSDIEPPVITFPVSGQDFTAIEPQNIIFSWTWPPGAPVSTQFVLKIIEVLPSDRNINDAFKSGAYPLFFEKTLNSPQYQYGPSDPRLIPGKSYAFSVTAIDPSQSTSFRNNGVSEIASFNYVTKGQACNGMHVEWDVNSIRKLYYEVKIENIFEEQAPSFDSYTITLDFLGNGIVNYSSTDTAAIRSIACNMSPGGSLNWNFNKGNIPTEIYIAFAPLKDPTGIINIGDSWNKISLPKGGVAQTDDALIINFKGIFQSVPSLQSDGQGIICIKLDVFYRIEPTEEAKNFYKKNNVTEMPFDWDIYLSGNVFFNCNLKCVEKAELNQLPVFKGGNTRIYTIVRRQANEIINEEK